MQPKNRFNDETDRAEYQLIYDGVRVYNNGASVYIDAEWGEISSFNLNYTDALFPDHKLAANLSAVYDKVLSEDNFRLGYLKIYDSETKENKAALVYAIEDNMILSAETLDKLDWSLEPIKEKEEFEYNDLYGHYAEDAAQKLLLMDICYDENMLRADDSVLQKDYLKLIARAVLNRSFAKTDEDFYNYMIRQGVLSKDNINPDAPITRISGVKYLLNALGYAEFAAIRGIFSCPFVDVAESDKGYGALAAGLGLVYSQTDTFSAQANLKRGDALIIIYNYLSR
jgi:regulator of RNase E activity RraB